MKCFICNELIQFRNNVGFLHMNTSLDKEHRALMCYLTNKTIYPIDRLNLFKDNPRYNDPGAPSG